MWDGKGVCASANTLLSERESKSLEGEKLKMINSKKINTQPSDYGAHE